MKLIIKRILRIVFGLIILIGGLTIGYGLYLVFSNQIKATSDMGFGLVVCTIGCPVLIITGIKFIVDKNYTID